MQHSMQGGAYDAMGILYKYVTVESCHTYEVANMCLKKHGFFDGGFFH